MLWKSSLVKTLCVQRGTLFRSSRHVHLQVPKLAPWGLGNCLGLGLLLLPVWKPLVLRQPVDILSGTVLTFGFNWSSNTCFIDHFLCVVGFWLPDAIHCLKTETILSEPKNTTLEIIHKTAQEAFLTMSYNLLFGGFWSVWVTGIGRGAGRIMACSRSWRPMWGLEARVPFEWN